MNRFECVYTRAECHHQGDKCSECPITELISDEFNECLDLSYQQGIADERPKAFAKGYDSGYQNGKADTIDEVEEKLNNAGTEIIFNLPVEEILGEDIDLDDFAMLVQDAIRVYRKMVLGVLKQLKGAGK